MANARRSIAKSTTQDLESRLLETVQRYELIFKATNDILYELDLVEGTVIWNEVLYEQYGYSKSQDTTKLEWWTARIHPDDALRIEQELSDWLESDKDTWESEYRFKIANGTYIFVRDRGVVQRNTDGMPIRIIGSFLDITRQRQLEHAKDEFISLVSHQLRTPLTAIRIYSDMLANGMFGPLENQQLKHAEYISDASVRLIKQVEDIVHISRVELGQTFSNPSLSNVNELLHRIIKDVSQEANEKNITIAFKPDASVRDIPIDPIIFRQVVDHLLKNSLRYTKPNKGKIVIAFYETSDGYELSIEDNGIGIPKSAQPHIFTRFYRARNVQNIKEQGNGLGLYLVKLLTDITGCRVWFKSGGKGKTVFYLQIPREGMN